ALQTAAGSDLPRLPADAESAFVAGPPQGVAGGDQARRADDVPFWGWRPVGRDGGARPRGAPPRREERLGRPERATVKRARGGAIPAARVSQGLGIMIRFRTAFRTLTGGKRTCQPERVNLS